MTAIKAADIGCVSCSTAKRFSMHVPTRSMLCFYLHLAFATLNSAKVNKSQAARDCRNGFPSVISLTPHIENPHLKRGL